MINAQDNKTRSSGELEAEKFLKKRGYKLLLLNFQTMFGKIEFICIKGKRLIFIVVREKEGHKFGTLESVINKKEKEQVTQAVHAFLQENPKIVNEYSQHRIDVVGLVFNKEKELQRLEHYRNIDRH